MAIPKTKRIKKAYYKPKAGEWLRPVKRGYRFACCDCGLVHLMNFRVQKGRAEFAVFRANRHTAAMRRSDDYPMVSSSYANELAAQLLKATGKKSIRIGKFRIRWRKDTKK